MLSQREFKHQLITLTYEAFAQKFDSVFDQPFLAKAALSRSIDPQRIFSIVKNDTLCGFVGYCSHAGSYFSFAPQKIRPLLNAAQYRQALQGLRLLRSPIDHSTFYIEALAVAPAFRHQGIAGQLLETCKTYAHTEGYLQVALDVCSENTTALALYQKHGFIFDHKRPLSNNMLGFSSFNHLIYFL